MVLIPQTRLLIVVLKIPMVSFINYVTLWGWGVSKRLQKFSCGGEVLKDYLIVCYAEIHQLKDMRRSQ